MSRKKSWRATGLALSVVALLLLAACSGAASTEQVSEQPSTAAAAQPSPTTPAEAKAAVPTDMAAPTASDEPAPTDTVAPTATPEPAPTSTATPAVGEDPTPPGSEENYRIITLLPPDAIPAIDDPEFYDVSEADREYGADELVIGVELEGEAKAYPIGLLSRHEIVNDTVGGRAIAVTW